MQPVLLAFCELSPKSQASARACVISVWRDEFKTDIQSAMAAFRKNLHSSINNGNYISYALRTLQTIKRIESDETYLDKLIEENLLMFSLEGDMYLFMQRRFVSEEKIQA